MNEMIDRFSLIGMAEGFANEGLTREEFEGLCADGVFNFSPDEIATIGERLDIQHGVESDEPS